MGISEEITERLSANLRSLCDAADLTQEVVLPGGRASELGESDGGDLRSGGEGRRHKRVG
jgi:hypothetical protein